MKIMRVNRDCPQGGTRAWVDDDGKLHANQLYRYICTADYYGFEKIRFNDTEITIKKSPRFGAGLLETNEKTT